MVNDSKRQELARRAAGISKLEARLERAHKAREEIRAQEETRREAADLALRDSRKDVEAARIELAEARGALAELIAQHVPRELVRAENDARALVYQLERHLADRRAVADRFKARVKQLGRKPAREMAQEIAREELAISELEDKLRQASTSQAKASKAMEAAVAAAVAV